MNSASGRRHPIIAIDGPAASGKSTAGRKLAQRLGYMYIDTGALYRASAWLALQHGLTPEKPAGLPELITAATITLEAGERGQRVLVDGRDIAGKIRSEKIGELASAFSALPEVRAALLGLQRRLGAPGGVVMDGRDIGTVVFPDAEVKIFLHASETERGRRRWSELLDRGEPADREEVAREMLRRDRRDRTRKSAPLKPAPDAVTIDSTSLTPEMVVDRIVALVKERR